MGTITAVEAMVRMGSYVFYGEFSSWHRFLAHFQNISDINNICINRHNIYHAIEQTQRTFFTLAAARHLMAHLVQGIHSLFCVIVDLDYLRFFGSYLSLILFKRTKYYSS